MIRDVEQSLAFGDKTFKFVKEQRMCVCVYLVIPNNDVGLEWRHSGEFKLQIDVYMGSANNFEVRKTSFSPN
jgi:hypothetical protein